MTGKRYTEAEKKEIWCRINAIDDAIKARGEMQKTVAAGAGMEAGTLCHLLKGDHVPLPETLMKLEKYLGIEKEVN